MYQRQLQIPHEQENLTKFMFDGVIKMGKYMHHSIMKVYLFVQFGDI